MPLQLESIYLGAALLGGALLVLQILLTLVAGDADGGDFDADSSLDGDGGAPVSFRTVVAFITFFGIAGMACRSAGLGPWVTLGIALVAGSLAFWLVGLVMLQLHRLRASGNVDVRNAVGSQARVYLVVPTARSGVGKVTVEIQGRTQEFKAMTAGPELPTGSLCKVLAVQAGDTLDVIAL